MSEQEKANEALRRQQAWYNMEILRGLLRETPAKAMEVAFRAKRKARNGFRAAAISCLMGCTLSGCQPATQTPTDVIRFTNDSVPEALDVSDLTVKVVFTPSHLRFGTNLLKPGDLLEVKDDLSLALVRKDVHVRYVEVEPQTPKDSEVFEFHITNELWVASPYVPQAPEETHADSTQSVNFFWIDGKTPTNWINGPSSGTGDLSLIEYEIAELKKTSRTHTRVLVALSVFVMLFSATVIVSKFPPK